MDYTDYMGELVSRCAPRWAWEVIDEYLAGLGSVSPDTLIRL